MAHYVEAGAERNPQPLPPPVASKPWAILWVSGESTNHEPKACTNCHMLWKKQETCAIHGPEIMIRALKSEGKLFTPVCGLHDPGKPMVSDEPMYPNKNDPDDTGLEWVEGKGSNCGGINEGRKCTAHYTAQDEEGHGKGFCRQLQATVLGTDCCASNEGEGMAWKEAQRLLKGKKKENG